MKNTKYTSDAMNFIKTVVEKNPAIEAKQKKLRSTWWDKDASDIAIESELDKTNLKPTAYAYFDYSKNQ